VRRGFETAIVLQHVRPMLTRPRGFVPLICAVPMMLLLSGPALAQVVPPPPAAAGDDDAKLDVAQPDFALVNLPTTLRLPLHRSNFRLTHRFLLNLQSQSFSENLADLFGLDNGAVVGLEYRFAPMRHLQAVVYRNNSDKTFQFSGQYDAVHQSASRPLSMSAIVSVEGANNFKTRYAPALGAVLSRTMRGRLAMYASPIWVHNTAALLGVTRETFFLGLGGQLRLSRRSYLVGETSPRVSGYAQGDPEFAFGIEERVGGHVFLLGFSNSTGSTYGQIARGGLPSSIYMGFNLGRKFF
jgi:hypothetical protein